MSCVVHYCVVTPSLFKSRFLKTAFDNINDSKPSNQLVFLLSPMSMMISLPVKCVQLCMMENHCGSYSVSVTLGMQRINVNIKDIRTCYEPKEKRGKVQDLFY